MFIAALVSKTVAGFDWIGISPFFVDNRVKERQRKLIKEQAYHFLPESSNNDYISGIGR